jgi:hypothetical protein
MVLVAELGYKPFGVGCLLVLRTLLEFGIDEDVRQKADKGYADKHDQRDSGAQVRLKAKPQPQLVG